jgi:hypothetical protein
MHYVGCKYHTATSNCVNRLTGQVELNEIEKQFNNELAALSDVESMYLYKISFITIIITFSKVQYLWIVA